VGGVLCVLILFSGVGSGSESKMPAESGSEIAGEVSDANGPTVFLGYDSEAPESNPTSAFMYFVPLISPTFVEMEISADNRQLARIISYEKNVDSKTFNLSCEFEMLGQGFFKTTFSASEVIDMFLAEQDEDEPMTNILDYIKFEGEGFGRVDVTGTISGSEKTVTEVVIHFNTRGHKSPVSIGLYSVRPEDGHFTYENKCNEQIAKIASLTFRKSGTKPKMEVKLVSVNKAEHPNGFVSKVKGKIANLFLNPISISQIGNDTMLDFGQSLLNEKSSFTFPLATNIKESRSVAIDDDTKSLSAAGI
jgi:hypothetical protein